MCYPVNVSNARGEKCTLYVCWTHAHTHNRLMEPAEKSTGEKFQSSQKKKKEKRKQKTRKQVTKGLCVDLCISSLVHKDGRKETPPMKILPEGKLLP